MYKREERIDATRLVHDKRIMLKSPMSMRFTLPENDEVFRYNKENPKIAIKVLIKL